MYTPHGYNLYHYDINSLYPYSMAKFDVPISNMKYFEGDIFKLGFTPFGFLFAEVTAPENLNIPILQILYKGRTISPLGKFTGWFFSEELFNARDNFGYKFKILKGYIFDKKKK